VTAICTCGPEWRNPWCDVHGDAHQECVQPSGNPGQLPSAPPPRVRCPSGTSGCGQIAAAPGRWWYCSTECRERNKGRP